MHRGGGAPVVGVPVGRVGGPPAPHGELPRGVHMHGGVGIHFYKGTW